MSRMVSFTILAGILLVIGVLFYKVMANFLLPMFLAVLLVVIFHPLYNWCIEKCKGRQRVAAGVTTAMIVLIVLLPLLGILSQAAVEGISIYHRLQASHPATKSAPETPDGEVDPEVDERSFADSVIDIKALSDLVVGLAEEVHVTLTPEDVETTIREKIEAWLAPAALNSVRFTGSLVLVLGVMVLSLYYFLADGPWMIRSIMRLSPLDDRYEQQLVDEFAKISRAVVVATLLSALVQGLLAGVGFYFADVSAVFLLTALAMLFAMVPFVGATAIWAPVCLWLYFVEERHLAAGLLALYCVLIVSMADNIIKPLVLHGRSNLHPLLALLSVLGGVQAMGPIGIFVGPMVVVFLHALLNMFQGELEQMGKKTTDEKGPQQPKPAVGA